MANLAAPEVRKGLPIVAYLVFGVSALVILAVGGVLLVTLSIATRNTFELLEDKGRLLITGIARELQLFLEPAAAEVEALARLIESGRLDPANPEQLFRALEAGLAASPHVSAMVYFDPSGWLMAARQGGKVPTPDVADWDRQPAGRRAIEQALARRQRAAYWGAPVYVKNQGIDPGQPAADPADRRQGQGRAGLDHHHADAVRVHDQHRDRARAERLHPVRSRLRPGAQHARAQLPGAGAETTAAAGHRDRRSGPVRDLGPGLAGPPAARRGVGPLEPGRRHPLPVPLPEPRAAAAIRTGWSAAISRSRRSTSSSSVCSWRWVWAPWAWWRRRSAAVWLGRRVSRPIAQLATAATAIRTLDLDDLAPLRRSRLREIDQAAIAFNAMLARPARFPTYVPRLLVLQLIGAGRDLARIRKTAGDRAVHRHRRLHGIAGRLRRPSWPSSSTVISAC